MRPWQHAQLSAGEDGDWLADLPIHEFVDSTKVACPHVRHRMILHNSDLGPELAARAFPERSDAREIARDHIAQDFKVTPSLAEWLALCDPAKFPTPLPDAPALESLPAAYARAQGLRDDDGPRAVLDLLLLPVTLAGPEAQPVLFNGMGPALTRRIIGAPRAVPGVDGNTTMFEPGHAAERMIHAVYGSIPPLTDVVNAVTRLPVMAKENA